MGITLSSWQEYVSMMLFEILIGVFVVALSVTYVIYVYYKYFLFNFWQKKGVFCIEPTIPIGNLGPLINNEMCIGEFFHKTYVKYKEHRVHGMYMLFKPGLVINDLDLIQTVLMKEFMSFHDRGMFSNEKIDPLSGRLTLLSGKKWRNVRGKLTSAFSPGKIKQMFTIIKEHADEFAMSLECKAETRDCIEMKDSFARYLTDVIMSMAFGIKSDSMKEEANEFRYWGKQIFEVSSFWNALFLFTPEVMNFFSVPYTKAKVAKFFTTMFQKNVEYRHTHNIVRYDFMNLLMQLMDKNCIDSNVKDIDDTNTNKLSMLKAAAQAYAIFLGGYETSSTTATYCLYELAQHQEIQNKVYEEFDEMIQKYGELTYNAVSEMTYLHKVVNETLRKYPPLPILVRVCTEEIDLPTTNIHVSKGTPVIIPTIGLHRDPLIYPNPEEFDPERFNEDEIARRHPCAYLPFGEGPRNCIGSRFAYLQTKVGIVSLLSKFKFKLHPRTSTPLAYDSGSMVLTVKGGVYLTIEPRQNN